MKLTIDGTPEEIQEFLQSQKQATFTAKVGEVSQSVTVSDDAAAKAIDKINDGYKGSIWHNTGLMV